jgi:hypothetical protein
MRGSFTAAGLCLADRTRPHSLSRQIRRKRIFSISADYCRPFANTPSGYDPIQHVRIRFRERLGRRRGAAAEEEHDSIDWLRQGAPEHKFAAAHGLPCEHDVFAAKSGPSFHVVVNDIVHEQVMHGRGWYHGGRRPG